MSVPLHSRNHTARPGYALHDMIDLPGWEDRSIWGWDADTSSFVAYLWPNGLTSDAPRFSLDDPQLYAWPGGIALGLVGVTQTDPLAVVQAMGIAHPEPTLRLENEILSKVNELNEYRHTSDYIVGLLEALAWIQGQTDVTPGSRIAWDGGRFPTPAEADAERHMITGRVALGGDQFHSRDFYSGIDVALIWVLGANTELP